MRPIIPFAVLNLLVAVSGCSGGSPTSPPSSAAAPSASAEPSTASSIEPSAAPTSGVSSTPAAAPVGDCPSGKYVLTRFSGTGLSTTQLVGTGSDVTITFTDGKYRLVGTGKTYEVQGEKAGETAQLKFDGQLDGTFSGSAPEVAYQPGQAKGKFTLTADGQTRSADLQTIGRTLAPHGSAKTSCTANGATITMSTVELTLRKG